MPILGPEVPVSAPLSVPADRADGTIASVASNGAIALTVWQQGSFIYASRLDRAGNLLDPFAIQVTTTPEERADARVVWDGSAFVVVWRSGTSLWTAAVGEDGRVGAAQKVATIRGFIQDAAAGFGVLAVAVRDSNYDNNLGPLVVYLIPPGQPAVKITLSDEYGKLTHLAATASGFVAVWLDGLYQREELHAARFSAWGAVEQRISVGFFPLTTSFGLAARGDDAYIVAGDKELTVLRVPRFASSAQLLARIPGAGYVKAMQTTEEGFIAVVAGIKSATLMRFSTAGEVIAAKPAPISDLWAAGVAVLDGRPYAVMTTPFAKVVNVYGEFADDASPPKVLSLAAENQRDPVIATDGERLLIAWNELHGSASSVKGVLAARDGRPISAPFEILPQRDDNDVIAATFAAGEYVVVRHEVGTHGYPLRDLVATHVSRDGVARGDRILISETASVYGHISLASDGTNVLVTWDGVTAGGRCAVLTPAGLTGARDFINGSVAVTWSGSTYAAAIPGTLSLARVTPDGAVTTLPYLPNVFASHPAIAWNGESFLVTYLGVGATNDSIMALPLDRNLQPVGEPVVVQAAGADTPQYGETPNLVWNGGTYDLTWIGRSDGLHFANRYLLRLTRAGRPAGPRIDLGQIAGPETTPYVFGLGGSASIIAYARMVPSLGGSERVFTRLLVAPHDRVVRH